jgi:hypothetical protein
MKKKHLHDRRFIRSSEFQGRRANNIYKIRHDEIQHEEEKEKGRR